MHPTQDKHESFKEIHQIYTWNTVYLYAESIPLKVVWLQSQSL